MYRIEYDQNKSMTYDPEKNQLSYRIDGSTKPFTEEQRLTQLFEITKARKRAPEERRPLYTAFMMKLVQGFKGAYYSVLQLVTDFRKPNCHEDKDAVRNVISDVMFRDIHVSSTFLC
jgi:hypothetical protein